MNINDMTNPQNTDALKILELSAASLKNLDSIEKKILPLCDDVASELTLDDEPPFCPAWPIAIMSAICFGLPVMLTYGLPVPV